MPLPAAIHAFGSTDLELGEDPRITRRSDGFDEGAFVFHGGTESSLLPGLPVPGYNGMYVAENVQTDRSGDFEHNLRAVGLRSATQRLITSTAVDSEDGFDLGSETWIAPANARFAQGRPHSDHDRLYCVSVVAKKSPVGNYNLYDLAFKGIKSGNRPLRVQTSVLGKEIRLENYTLVGPGGHSQPHTWSVLRGDPVLNISFLSQVAPNYARVGVMGSRPPDFPAVASLPFSVATDQTLWQWPNGVVLVSINAERVLNENVWFVTESYVNRDRVTV